MDDTHFNELLQSVREGGELLRASSPPDPRGPRTFSLPPPAPGRCPVCASRHEGTLAHNRGSLYYQLAFRREHGRWPTWKDACAELPEAEQALWRQLLAERGEPWE